MKLHNVVSVNALQSCANSLIYRLLFSVHGNKSLGDFRKGGVGSVVAETFLSHGLADAADCAFIAIHLAAGIDEHTNTHTLSATFPPILCIVLCQTR